MWACLRVECKNVANHGLKSIGHLEPVYLPYLAGIHKKYLLENESNTSFLAKRQIYVMLLVISYNTITCAVTSCGPIVFIPVSRKGSDRVKRELVQKSVF